jgi:hypothetical protein
MRFVYASERVISAEKLKENDAAGPDICWAAIIATFADDLRRNITRSSTEAVQLTIAFNAKPEVDKLDDLLCSQQNIVDFDVPVANVPTMEIADCLNQLLKEWFGFYLRHSGVLSPGQRCLQRRAVHQLSYDVDLR